MDSLLEIILLLLVCRHTLTDSAKVEAILSSLYISCRLPSVGIVNNLRIVIALVSRLTNRLLEMLVYGGVDLGAQIV